MCSTPGKNYVDDDEDYYYDYGDDDLYISSLFLLFYYNNEEMISQLPDLGIRVPKKQKSSEFNSRHDGIII